MRQYFEIPFILIACCLAIWFYGQTMLVHDVAWYLVATAHWLHGAVLYQDIMEVNPPLSFYIMAPPVWLALKTALTKKLALVIWVCGLAGISLAWSGYLIRETSGPGRRAGLLLAGVVVLLVLPVNAFAQREHFLLILALPCIIYMAFEPHASRGHRITLALFAFFGLALKPYFMLVPLFIGLYNICRRCDWRVVLRAEYSTLVIGCLVYLGFVWLVHPAYYTTIVPTALLVYGAYESSFRAVILSVALYVLPVVFCFIVSASRVLRRPARHAALVLWLTAMALAVAYLLAFKAWFYHAMPVYGALILAVAWLVLCIPGHFNHWLRGFVLSIVVLLLLAPIARGPYSNHWVADFKPYLPADKGKRSVLALSTHVWVIFPLANRYDAAADAGYSALWPIPGAVQLLRHPDASAAEKARARHILHRVRQNVVQSFAQHQPAVVFVDLRKGRDYFGGHDFSFIGFFSQNARFAHAWQAHYVRVARVSGYAIYQRDPDAWLSLKEASSLKRDT